MSPILRVLTVLASFLLLVIILELVRRGKLREEYSLLLLLISGLIFFLAIFRNVLAGVAETLGVAYTPSVLVGVAFLTTFAVQIAQGVIISSLSLHSRSLVQKAAELEWQLLQLRGYAREQEKREPGESATWIATAREMVTRAEGSEGELAR